MSWLWSVLFAIVMVIITWVKIRNDEMEENN